MTSYAHVPVELARRIVETLLSDAEGISGEWGSGGTVDQIREGDDSEAGSAQVHLADELSELLPSTAVRPAGWIALPEAPASSEIADVVGVAELVAAEDADLMRRLE
ncbi:hypothetical protein [Curtobacterium oceanosedimentum]|uniref:Uncharacterized protein n=1 Tax=Curtobacterium oceanosedimentum TaxID=465820 RepID=A0A147DM40_9MICO|nr:hypothetical protein [Curtobacterium oceanosedimentum]KTR47309.1 hypothetical protein NS359_15185 [Curtobacterium oceanosedimentum]